MAIKGLKFSLAVVLLTSLVVLSALSAATAKTDPELKQCQHQCKHQERFMERQQEQCEQRCGDYYRQKERERDSEEGGSSSGRGKESSRGDERKQLRECQRQCERQQGSSQQKQACRNQCQKRFGEKETDPWSREVEKREIGNRREEEQEEESWEEEQEEEISEENNPYVFQQEHFSLKVHTEHGRVRLLPRFTKRSKLLRGIENYRLGVLEANPQTFVVPNHWDADGVLFVISGRGTLTMVQENKRNSINVGKGDIIRVPAGTPVYLANRDENEQLHIANFLQPVNTPGQFEVYHATGGKNPEAFYTAFSWEVLEAAFKTGRDKLERMFRQQQQGAIVKASKEQIEAMSQADEEGSHWPFGGDEELGRLWPTRGSRGSHSYSFNIFNKRPSESNQYGQLYEVDQDDFKHLKDLDLMVSFANITRGSMTTLYYNSRATKIAMVVDGEGWLEMACPHLSSRQQGRRHSTRGQRRTGSPTTYQKVQARLNRGTVFIVPAGHPATSIASRNSNLQVVCFEVNAKNNVRYTLAGRRNIVGQMHREAKELAFNFPARDIDRIFKNQDEEFFFPGPARQEEVIRRYGDA
ncbi:sucrose-binding protein [Punica granatum]|uniref:Cupin type-1 domain-containing protein n=2 Tax=Punica granatum TaxID=22663 RepID=A0A218WQI4_PUNGR|nr:sucrose-binding protein [Punica granatum]OWM74728.1 hypothetical protein CDL15_Pgr009275 [Punica granatum]PKI37356.1 hypothetical protein CRG98_042233 [Punica granatum]